MNTQVIKFEDCLKAGEIVWHAVPTKVVGESIKKGEPAVIVETDCSKFGILSKFNGLVIYSNESAIDEPCDIVITIEEKKADSKKGTKKEVPSPYFTINIDSGNRINWGGEFDDRVRIRPVEWEGPRTLEEAEQQLARRRLGRLIDDIQTARVIAFDEFAEMPAPEVQDGIL